MYFEARLPTSFVAIRCVDHLATGLLRSHPPSWVSLGLVLCWPELILEEWELWGSQINTMGVAALDYYNFLKELGNQTPNLNSVTLSDRCTTWKLYTNVMTFTKEKIERAWSRELIFDPYCCDWRVYPPPQFWRFVNNVYAFRLSVRRAIQELYFVKGPRGKVRLQNQWKRHRQCNRPVAWPALNQRSLRSQEISDFVGKAMEINALFILSWKSNYSTCKHEAILLHINYGA